MSITNFQCGFCSQLSRQLSARLIKSKAISFEQFPNIALLNRERSVDQLIMIKVFSFAILRSTSIQKRETEMIVRYFPCIWREKTSSEVCYILSYLTCLSFLVILSAPLPQQGNVIRAGVNCLVWWAVDTRVIKRKKLNEVLLGVNQAKSERLNSSLIST